MNYEVEVDNAELLAALDSVGDYAEVYLDRASEVTANRIAIEARSRVARRTGKTQEGIVVEESYLGSGYVVISARQPMPNLPHWIEKGTKFQEARPYLEPAIELEREPHRGRIAEAIQRAVDEKGLGA